MHFVGSDFITLRLDICHETIRRNTESKCMNCVPHALNVCFDHSLSIEAVIQEPV